MVRVQSLRVILIGKTRITQVYSNHVIVPSYSIAWVCTHDKVFKDKMYVVDKWYIGLCIRCLFTTLIISPMRPLHATRCLQIDSHDVWVWRYCIIQSAECLTSPCCTAKLNYVSTKRLRVCCSYRHTVSGFHKASVQFKYGLWLYLWTHIFKLLFLRKHKWLICFLFYPF